MYFERTKRYMTSHVYKRAPKLKLRRAQNVHWSMTRNHKIWYVLIPADILILNLNLIHLKINLQNNQTCESLSLFHSAVIENNWNEKKMTICSIQYGRQIINLPKKWLIVLITSQQFWWKYIKGCLIPWQLLQQILIITIFILFCADQKVVQVERNEIITLIL